MDKLKSIEDVEALVDSLYRNGGRPEVWSLDGLKIAAKASPRGFTNAAKIVSRCTAKYAERCEVMEYVRVEFQPEKPPFVNVVATDGRRLEAHRLDASQIEGRGEAHLSRTDVKFLDKLGKGLGTDQLPLGITYEHKLAVLFDGVGKALVFKGCDYMYPNWESAVPDPSRFISRITCNAFVLWNVAQSVTEANKLFNVEHKPLHLEVGDGKLKYHSEPQNLQEGSCSTMSITGEVPGENQGPAASTAVNPAYLASALEPYRRNKNVAATLFFQKNPEYAIRVAVEEHVTHILMPVRV